MSSSKKTLEDYLIQNDFTEIAQRARASARQKAEEERQRALNPTKDAEILAAEKRGFDQGVLQGKEEALATLRLEMESHISALKLKFETLGEVKTLYAQQMEKKASELTALVMTKVMGEIQHQFKDELIHAAFRQALLEIEDNTKLTVYINPESKNYLHAHVADILDTWDIHWQTNPDLQQGECFIEWDTAGFNLSTDKRMDEIYNLVQSALNQSFGIEDIPLEAVADTEETSLIENSSHTTVEKTAAQEESLAQTIHEPTVETAPQTDENEAGKA